MMNLLNLFFRSLIEYVFRRPSVGASLVKWGSTLLSAVLAGLSVGITIPTSNGPYKFSWDTSGGAAALSWGVFVIAALMILTGVALILRDVRRENRGKVIVIEARGLRDWNGEPLETAVPVSLKGRRDPVLVDVRQGLIDGQIISPDRALRHLTSLPDDIARRVGGLDRADISFVLGGLAPVPLLFLLGVIVDDEHHTLFMDWDRSQKTWRPLDDDDDGLSFRISGPGAIPAGSSRVALCVSASYDVLDADVRLVEPTVPIVRLDLEGRSTVSHWSERKQQRLAQQFLDAVMDLARQGVTDISLFLASPASLSLRLGTVYDKRNLPSVAVNQFEQGDPKKFPWAVVMPVAGMVEPRLKQR